MPDEDSFGSGRYEKLLLKFLGEVQYFKLPLVIAAIGFLLLIFSIILSVKNSFSSSEVLFSQESSQSALIGSNLRIDIEGAVKKPGIFSLGKDSRIEDAIIIAGGLSDGADIEWIAKNLNRAAKLVDGGKIYIPSFGETSEGKVQSSKIKVQNERGNNLLGVNSSLVNINSAVQTELEALPGVGPVTAKKIIEGRPYQTLDELTGRKVVGQSVFDKIKNLISI